MTCDSALPALTWHTRHYPLWHTTHCCIVLHAGVTDTQVRDLEARLLEEREEKAALSGTPAAQTNDHARVMM
jgi:hypothetical protein